MGKNDKEKNLIYEWGIEKQDAYRFMEINKDLESYFQDRKDHNYLREYYFDTLPELREYLRLLWKEESYMEDILQPVLVASMKNRAETSKVSKDSEPIGKTSYENKEKMPAYIYNF